MSLQISSRHGEKELSEETFATVPEEISSSCLWWKRSKPIALLKLKQTAFKSVLSCKSVLSLQMSNRNLCLILRKPRLRCFAPSHGRKFIVRQEAICRVFVKSGSRSMKILWFSLEVPAIPSNPGKSSFICSTCSWFHLIAREIIREWQVVSVRMMCKRCQCDRQLKGLLLRFQHRKRQQLIADSPCRKMTERFWSNIYAFLDVLITRTARPRLLEQVSLFQTSRILTCPGYLCASY